MMECDDCKKEIQGTHIYWKGKNRCWKCDELFAKSQKREVKNNGIFTYK